MSRTVTITLPARGGVVNVSDLDRFGRLVSSYSDVLDVISDTWKGPVPRRLTQALDLLREDLVGLGEMIITVAVTQEDGK